MTTMKKILLVAIAGLILSTIFYAGLKSKTLFATPGDGIDVDASKQMQQLNQKMQQITQQPPTVSPLPLKVASPEHWGKLCYSDTTVKFVDQGNCGALSTTYIWVK